MIRRGIAEASAGKTELKQPERMEVIISLAGVAAQKMKRAERFVALRIVHDEDTLVFKKCSCALITQSLLMR